jgi:hypothetical protein
VSVPSKPFHPILTLSDVRLIFRLTEEQALRSFASLITSNEIAEMLRASGAPEPWENPEKCETIGVVTLTPLDEGFYDEKASKKAQAAIQTLRQYLPKVLQSHIALLSSIDGYTEQEPTAHALRLLEGRQHYCKLLQDKISSLERFSKAVEEAPEIIVRRRGFGMRADWHHHAHRLFGYYRSVVDRDCGISAEGPAARFIFTALTRLGLHKRTPVLARRESALNAIEWALGELERKFRASQTPRKR